MFSRVELRQIRGHKETSIALDRFTVFVGPNGTGKSTVLWMLGRTCAVLRGVVEGQRSDYTQAIAGGQVADTLARRGAHEMSCAVFSDSGDASTAVVRWARDRGEWSVDGWLDAAGFDVARKWSQNPYEAGLCRDWAQRLSAVSFALEPSRIMQKFDIRSTTTRVGGDGSSTAGLLLQLAQRRDKSAYDAIVASMRELVDHLRGVRPVVTTGNDSGVQLVYDFTDADDVAAHCVSDGTLLATAFLTALHGDDQPRVLLLDDIERGLHPSAQLRFVKQLKAMLEIQPELQIIATTHSPFILDALEPSQVRAFARRRDGSVAVKSLAEHPMAQENDGALTTGQLWSLDDEATWVLPEEERRP